MTAPKRIGIAIVEQGGRYLVGVRGPNIPLAGYSEFPGGKCAAGESAIDCALRECLEETGLIVEPDRLLQQLEFEYPHGRVDLHFVICHPARQADVRETHNGFRWVSIDELRTLRFPEANATVVDLLTQGTISERPTNPC